jgi:hypothetical protein
MSRCFLKIAEHTFKGVNSLSGSLSGLPSYATKLFYTSPKGKYIITQAGIITHLYSSIFLFLLLKIIKRTPDILYTLCSNMCIYLSCLAALMSQQLLYIPQIRTRFKQMGGITMP